MPPRGSLAWALEPEDVLPAQDVQVEAAEAEDGVIEVVLVAERELCYRIVSHHTVVVGRFQAVEKPVRDCEERHVLDIWIVFRGICHDVVDVVVALPPAAGEAAEEVGDEDADYGVCVEVVGYAHVAGVVDGED